MPKNVVNMRRPAVVSLVVLAVLAVGAFVFFRARMFADAAFIVFDLINHNSLQIQDERYGSFITQIVPLIALRLHLPLKAILICYSASFNLFYLGAALILFYRFKEYGLVVLMGLYFTLYVSDSYFWTNCELHQGVCWMFLALGSLRYFSSRATQSGQPGYHFVAAMCFSVLGFLAVFSHPAVIIPFMFLWGFFWLAQDSPPFTKKYSVAYFAVLAALGGVKYFLSARNSYDGKNLAGLHKAGLSDVFATFTSGAADGFWKDCLHNCWLLPILFMISIAVLIKQRRYWLLLWTLLANVGFFVVLCLTVGYLKITFHRESEAMPFGILGAAAFVWYVLPQVRSARLAVFVVMGIFLVRLTYIGLAAPKFVARARQVDDILAFMKKRQIKKMIILQKDNRLDDRLILAWALPYEGLLYSKIEDNGVPSTMLGASENDIKTILPQEPLKDFRTPWSFVTRMDLNPKYFNTDTLRPYDAVSSDELLEKP